MDATTEFDDLDNESRHNIWEIMVSVYFKLYYLRHHMKINIFRTKGITML